ncbi:MAG: FlgD immunoglobulin-like domain containing protein [Candidatus Latescibacterota bacterium]
MLDFALPSRTPVTLRIYDLLGQPVVTLVNGILDAGRHTAVWDGRDEAGRPMASGLYSCRLQAGERVQMRTLMRLR